MDEIEIEIPGKDENNSCSDNEYDECSFVRDDSLKRIKGLYDEELVLEDYDDESVDELDESYLPSPELIAQKLQEYNVTFLDLVKAFLSATDEEYQADVSIMIAEGKVGGKICAIKKEVTKL
jgi:hypothetical protein